MQANEEFDCLADEIMFKARRFVKLCEPVKFVVRQSNLIADLFKKMFIFCQEEDLKLITVEFIGEEAADEGGPLCEIFTLMDDGVAQKLMCGEEKDMSFNMMFSN